MCGEMARLRFHGGHSTAMRALAHDLPLVLMPMFSLGDQPTVGRVLQTLGTARVVAKTASAEEMRAAIAQVLATATYREAAQTLGPKVRRQDGAVAAVDALEAARLLSSVPVDAAS
jgi:UDP:flavonoid glycosyltransferase YjiC (YdhE family)